MTISVIAPRFKCAAVLKKLAKDNGSGRSVITNVKITKVGVFVWHLEFTSARSVI